MNIKVLKENMVRFNTKNINEQASNGQFEMQFEDNVFYIKFEVEEGMGSVDFNTSTKFERNDGSSTNILINLLGYSGNKEHQASDFAYNGRPGAEDQKLWFKTIQDLIVKSGIPLETDEEDEPDPIVIRTPSAKTTIKLSTGKTLDIQLIHATADYEFQEQPTIRAIFKATLVN